MSQIEEKLSQNSQWKDAKEIIKKLSCEGYQAVLAGGGVRDSLLGLIPKDFDIATSAKPEEILKIFPEAKKTWVKYGVTLIPLKNTKIHLDITTFRKETTYKDGRHPDSIEYTSMEEDAKRRDFTINALFYDIEQQKVLDFVDGLKDLKTKTLRVVGDCNKRFQEDHLRILRALRFSHQLKFSIEQETQKSLLLLSQNLSKISQERITNELLKMFVAGEIGDGLKLLDQYKVLNLVFRLPDKCSKDPCLFWRQAFSFYKDTSYMWVVVGFPYFQNESLFKTYLQELKLSSSDIKISLSYFKALQNLLSPSSSLADQLKSLQVHPEKIKELSLLWCKSYGIPDDKLHAVFKRFEKIQVWPKPIVTSADLFKEACFPEVKFSYFLNTAFDLQIENTKINKEEILRALKKLI